MGHSKPGRPVLLRAPTLGVSEPKSPDDEQAIAMLQELIQEVDPDVKLNIIAAGEGRMTPWLRSSDSLFRGLSQIKGFIEVERSLQFPR